MVVPEITDIKCGADCITLSWSLNYKKEPVKYVVKYRKTEGRWYEISDITDQTFKIQDLMPTTVYFVQITAYTASLRSCPSAEKECTTTRGEPVYLIEVFCFSNVLHYFIDLCCRVSTSCDFVFLSAA